MSAYNSPTETLPIFNLSVFPISSLTSDPTKVNYPAVQGKISA